jgi:hypothetical protein
VAEKIAQSHQMVLPAANLNQRVRARAQQARLLTRIANLKLVTPVLLLRKRLLPFPMANHLAIKSVVVAVVENHGPVADPCCAGQRLTQKSSSGAKDESAMVVRSVDTKCAYKFVMELLR